jgi:hypothetical protein
VKNSSVVPREVGRNEYPALPREPARGTPGVVNIVIRLPYGRRIQRQFLATDPIQVFPFLGGVCFHGRVFLLSCIICVLISSFYMVEYCRYFGLSLPLKFQKTKNLCSSLLHGD